MNISDNYYKIILDEFKQVKINCNKAKTPEDKLYFFSASYGILNRIFNLEYNPTLVFMHQVLNNLHQAVNQRLTAPSMPGSIANALPNEIWEKMFTTYGKLVEDFEKKDEMAILQTLQELSSIGYATTGNGYYLYTQGKLTL